MDFTPVIQDLRDRAQKLLDTAELLEKIYGTTPEVPENGTGKRRGGRKSMSDQERAEVSERMKRYWARRRRSAANL